MTANKDRLHGQVENLCLTLERENNSWGQGRSSSTIYRVEEPRDSKARKEKLGLNTSQDRTFRTGWPDTIIGQDVRIGTERKSDQTKNVNQKTDLCELDRDLRQDTDRQDIMQDGQQMNTKSKQEGKKETGDRTAGEY